MSVTIGLPVGMTERRVVDHDVFLGHALRFQVGLQDLVGRLRIDVVGAGEHPALHRAAVLAHQVVDGRDGLLVRRGAGVEHVALAFLALILDGIEEQAVQFLEHRQHGLARHRGPAAEHRRHLVDRDQLARLFGKQRPVGSRIDDDRLELLAEQAALLVLLVDQEQHRVLQRRLRNRHRARQRMQDADLDRLFLRHRRRGEADARQRSRLRTGNSLLSINTPHTEISHWALHRIQAMQWLCQLKKASLHTSVFAAISADYESRLQVVHEAACRRRACREGILRSAQNSV